MKYIFPYTFSISFTCKETSFSYPVSEESWIEFPQSRAWDRDLVPEIDWGCDLLERPAKKELEQDKGEEDYKKMLPHIKWNLGLIQGKLLKYKLPLQSCFPLRPAICNLYHIGIGYKSPWE